MVFNHVYFVFPEALPFSYEVYSSSDSDGSYYTWWDQSSPLKSRWALINLRICMIFVYLLKYVAIVSKVSFGFLLQWAMIFYLNSR